MTDQDKAYLFGLVTALLWSTVAAVFKLSLRYLDPLELLLYASAVSLAVLAIVLRAQGRLGLVFACSRDQYVRSAALGFLNPFLYYLVLFKAYDLLPAQEAQPLNYTWAITLALLSIPLLGQKIRSRDILAGLVSYAGVLVISTHGHVLSLRFSNPLGVALALGSTVVWALYWIGNTRDDRDPVAGLLLNFAAGLVFVTIYWLAFGSPRRPDPYGLLGAAYVGVFEMGITYVTWLTALKLSENTAKVGNLIFISPFLSLVFIRFLTGERIRSATFVGLVFIVAGLLIQRRRGKVRGGGGPRANGCAEVPSEASSQNGEACRGPGASPPAPQDPGSASPVRAALARQGQGIAHPGDMVSSPPAPSPGRPPVLRESQSMEAIPDLEETSGGRT